MADETIQCLVCKQNFVWAQREQEFFKSQGLTNKPKRCPPCRQKRREEREQRTKENVKEQA